MVPGHPARGL